MLKSNIGQMCGGGANLLELRSFVTYIIAVISTHQRNSWLIVIDIEAHRELRMQLLTKLITQACG